MRALDFENFDKLLEFRNYEPINQTLQEKWIMNNCKEWLKSLNNPNSVSLWRGGNFTQKNILLVDPKDTEGNRVSKYSDTMNKIYIRMENLADFKYHEPRLKSIFASISYKEADEHCGIGVQPVEMIVPDHARLSSTSKDFNELERTIDLRGLFRKLDNLKMDWKQIEDEDEGQIEFRIKDKLQELSKEIKTITAEELYSKEDNPKIKAEYWTTSQVLLVPNSLRDRFRLYYKHFKMNGDKEINTKEIIDTLKKKFGL